MYAVEMLTRMGLVTVNTPGGLMPDKIIALTGFTVSNEAVMDEAVELPIETNPLLAEPEEGAEGSPAVFDIQRSIS